MSVTVNFFLHLVLIVRRRAWVMKCRKVQRGMRRERYRKMVLWSSWASNQDRGAFLPEHRHALEMLRTAELSAKSEALNIKSVRLTWASISDTHHMMNV